MISKRFWPFAAPIAWRLIVQAFLVTGCSTLQPLDMTEGHSVAQSIRPGDQVRITQLDNVVLRFTVTQVDDDRIAGKRHSVAFDTIRSIEVEKPDPAATRVLMIALAVAGLAVMAAGNSLVAVTW